MSLPAHACILHTCIIGQGHLKVKGKVTKVQDSVNVKLQKITFDCLCDVSYCVKGMSSTKRFSYLNCIVKWFS